MIARIRAALVGMMSSLIAPFWLSSKRLESLTREPPYSNDDVRAEDRVDELKFARRISDRMLAALPRPLWRTSCLYRSIAECLTLRSYGVPATVVMGVRRAGEKVQAHAWVAVRGVPFPASAASVVHPGLCQDPRAFQPLVAADSRSRG